MVQKTLISFKYSYAKILIKSTKHSISTFSFTNSLFVFFLRIEILNINYLNHAKHYTVVLSKNTINLDCNIFAYERSNKIAFYAAFVRLEDGSITPHMKYIIIGLRFNLNIGDTMCLSFYVVKV